MTKEIVGDLCKIESSSIDGYKWYPSSLGGDLILKFKSGSFYRYKDVPTYIFRDFQFADSHGKYFYENIKDKYVTEKMDVEEINFDTILE